MIRQVMLSVILFLWLVLVVTSAQVPDGLPVTSHSISTMTHHLEKRPPPPVPIDNCCVSDGNTRPCIITAATSKAVKTQIR